MAQTKQSFSAYFGWEEIPEIEEWAMDMIEQIVPYGEFNGQVRISIEYLPGEDE